MLRIPERSSGWLGAEWKTRGVHGRQEQGRHWEMGAVERGSHGSGLGKMMVRNTGLSYRCLTVVRYQCLTLRR